MPLLTIDISTSDSLSCACCMPADVILCVDPVKIALETCSGGGTKTQKRTIPATLIGRMIVPQSSCATIYRYTVQYDAALITAGQTLLPADVRNIVCKSCLTTWIEDLVGQPSTLAVVDGTTLRFIDQYGCVTDIPLTSLQPV